MASFCCQFGSILGPKLKPKSRSRRSQNALKTLPRRHQDSPRTTRVKFNRFLVRPKGVPYRTVRWGTHPGPRFSKFVGPFWYNCWCQVCAKEFEQHLIKFQRSKGRSITLCCWRGGGVAALLRCWILVSAAPGLVPAHGV